MTGSPFWVEDSNVDWMADGACIGEAPDLFFPHGGSSMTDEDAKAICARCSVRPECLDYAMRHGIHFGTWGGMNSTDRQRLRRQRALARRRAS